jgi:lysozyme family protein
MAEFNPAFQFTMSHEDAARSGKVTRDGDGRTRFGICERFHPTLPEDFWTGPADKAFTRAAYLFSRDYWEPMRLDEIVDQAVASKLFDMCIPMGLEEATILAQRAANGLLLGSSRAPAIDGKIGDKTIAALNACPPASVVEAFCNLSKIFFSEVVTKKPEKKDDLEGWLRRAAAVPPHAPTAEPVAKGVSA